MRRRVFFVGSLALVAGAAAVVVQRRWPTPLRLRRQLARLEGLGRSPLARLQRRYAWLAVEPGVFERYLADYERYVRPLHRTSVPDPDFFTRFLLSTNFFMSGGAYVRDGKPASYSVFYLPGESPCYNPLAGRPPSNAELTRDAAWRLARSDANPRAFF